MNYLMIIGMSAAITSGTSLPADAQTSLNCDGFPKAVPVSTNSGPENFVQVCRLVRQASPVTPVTRTLSVTTAVGNVMAHGTGTGSMIPVYARIIAQDATVSAATSLANSVVISTARSAVSASPNQETYPRQLEIDFEVFTPPSIAATLNTMAGNVEADTYDASLKAIAQTGNVSLSSVSGTASAHTGSGNVSLSSVSGAVTATTSAGDLSLSSVSGAVTATTNAGNIDVELTGAGWVGQGLTAVAMSGNVTLNRPAGYAAKITGTTDIGSVTIDGKTVTANFTTPVTETVGTGQPISLRTHVGNVSVGRN